MEQEINYFENEQKFIKGLNFKSALKHRTSIHGLMKALSEKYNAEYTKKYKTDVPLFTYFTDADLVELIETKYHITCQIHVDWSVINPND